jgi:hypothetical protein
MEIIRKSRNVKLPYQAEQDSRYDDSDGLESLSEGIPEEKSF